MNLSLTPIFSIIVPVFNVDAYLEKCLQSIVGQTLDNIEVIVVDDGSTDSSLEICHRFATKHKNFRVFSKKNEGQGIARNLGLFHATGQYVCYVDSDDWIEPELCVNMQKIFRETNADFINFGLHYVTHVGKITKRFNRFKVPELLNEEIFFRALLDDHVFSSPCNKAYRRQFLNDHDIKFPPLRAYEDLYYSRAIARVAEKVVFDPRIYYHALVRSGSTTRKMSSNNFTIAENLVNFERTKFFRNDKDKIFEDRFQAHVIKLFSYLLIQSAFAIKPYSEYIFGFEVVRRNKFYDYSSNRVAINMLSVKNRFMVRLCKYPLVLRSIALILGTIGIRPY